VSITFTPASSGKRTGSLTVVSNAASGSGTVALTGMGNAVFSLSANTRSTVIQIGDASTTKPTFTIYASAASSFTDSIVLSCATGSCTFDPTSIKAGESSTLTVSGLSPTTSNPLNLTVNGVSGGQTATVGLTIFFSDFALSASPTLRTINAGQSASYTVTVTPSNGFTGVVLLACRNLPQEADCSWSPSAVYLNGSTVTATVTVNTTTQKSGLSPPPNSILPLGPRTGAILWAAWGALALLAAKALCSRQRDGTGWAHARKSLRLAALGMLLAAAALAFGCSDYTIGLNITRAAPGTPAGNYTIVITGTLGNNSSVSRQTTFNLSVGSG
jgi:hypothetical protein